MTNTINYDIIIVQDNTCAIIFLPHERVDTMFLTYKGREIDYENIKKEDICIEDIIHSIVKINRFIGHSSRPYNVGEHTLYCLLMAEKLGYSVRERLLTFIHDFTEAYVGDCPAPLKCLLPEFEYYERLAEIAINEYLEIDMPTVEEHKKVKRIDMTMLVIEMKQLTLHSYERYVDGNTYADMIDDDDFFLNKEEGINETTLKNILTTLFNDLMQQYRKEIQNG